MHTEVIAKADHQISLDLKCLLVAGKRPPENKNNGVLGMDELLILC